jgi:short subunit dehydrogenase-like uncharacterized protein
VIQTPRPKLPASYTNSLPDSCLQHGATYQDAIEEIKRLRQIIEQYKQKLKAIRIWEDQLQ